MHQEFQGLLREGDHVVFDYVTGTMDVDENGLWRGQIRLPRNSRPDQIPQVSRYYELHLKDGRWSVVVIERALTDIAGRYPTLQFSGGRSSSV